MVELSDNLIQEPSISEIRIHQIAETDSLRLTDLHWHVNSNEDYMQLKDVIFKRFPANKRKVQELCKQYRQAQHDLTIDKDLIVYGYYLYIPRTEVPNQLHES